MKRLFVYIGVIVLSLALMAQAPVYNDTYYRESPGRALGGEHTPLVYNINSAWDTLGGPTEIDTSYWMQTGYCEQGSDAMNRLLFHLNPEFFIYDVQVSATASDDSAGVNVYFETCWDTTETPSDNFDDSNYFIKDGNSAHALYQIWVREEILDDSASVRVQRYRCFLRVPAGAWIRFIKSGASNCADSMRYKDRLICEH